MDCVEEVKEASYLEARRFQVVSKPRRREYQTFTGCHIFNIIFSLLSQFMIGAVNMLVIEYTVKTGDLHALLCTHAWHLYTIEAIFAMMFTNAWGSYTTLFHRRVRLAHMIFQIISLFNILTGSVIIFIAKSKKNMYVHGMSGIVTLILFMMTVVVGPASMISQVNQNIKFFHICFAVPTFVLTSVVLSLGFYKDRYKKIIGIKLCYVQTVFVAFYTLYIVLTIFINGVHRIRANKYNF